MFNINLVYLTFYLFLLPFLSCKNEPDTDYSSWTSYAGSPDGNRYSSNDQINKDNVSQLKEAWRYSSRDKDLNNRSQNQCNPIIIDGILYGISPKLKLFALNAATGVQKWIFDPALLEKNVNSSSFLKVSRGIAYWQDGDDKRLLYTGGAKLYAIDAVSGKLIPTFGTNGVLDLKKDLDVQNEGDFFLSCTSPGIVFKDLIIIGNRVTGAPGNIRAFDIKTGKRRWIFHVIPHPGEVGYESWDDKNAWKKFNEANSWAGLSLDTKRGLVYIPTGSADPDFYGGNRKGNNLFGCSLIALDASTGEYKWHFQVVHHDLWDRDLPANPNLVTIKHDGKSIDAVAQITKHGYIYMFNRENGEPIFPIKEVVVPTKALPGEHPSQTQPIPTLPERFARSKFGPEDVSDLFPETKAALMKQYLAVKNRAEFTPPSKEGSWIFPGFDGGGEWGGAAVDMETQIMYVNSSELPWSLVMIDKPKNTDDKSIYAKGHAVYNTHCIGCHGPQLKGNGAALPSLENLNKKYNDKQVLQIINNGRNMMPSFKQISENDKKELISFVLKLKPKATAEKPSVVTTANNAQSRNEVDGPGNSPYTMNGWNRFLDKNGYPGIKPPWGTLNAINLNTGKLLWKVPLGEYKELTAKGIPPTGTENYGGPLVTKGGLVFIAASKDEKIRAFDKNTGKILWEAQLPVAGFATPATYFLDGKQYVVINCGGGKIGNKSGDEYVAFSL